MSHRKCKTVYYYRELGEAAKAVARNQWRDGGLPEGWEDGTIADFIKVAKILGVEMSYGAVPVVAGVSREEPRIFFSVEANVGLGASFDGCYGYSKGWRKKLAAYAPLDKALLEIGNLLQKAQRHAAYGAYAEISKLGSFFEPGSILVRVGYEGDAPSSYAVDSAIEEAIRLLAGWLHTRLVAEWEYQLSDNRADSLLLEDEISEFEVNGITAQEAIR